MINITTLKIIESTPVVIENNLILDLNETIKSITSTNRGKSKIPNLYDEFVCLDKTQKRTEKLDMLYNSLLTISPTSTISERVFSKSSFIKTKKKQNEGKHLNNILFLKDYFKRSN